MFLGQTNRAIDHASQGPIGRVQVDLGTRDIGTYASATGFRKRIRDSKIRRTAYHNPVG